MALLSIAESGPSTIGLITLTAKQAGEPGARNGHAGIDVAGAGNGTARLPRQPPTLPMSGGGKRVHVTNPNAACGLFDGHRSIPRPPSTLPEF